MSELKVLIDAFGAVIETFVIFTFFQTFFAKLKFSKRILLLCYLILCLLDFFLNVVTGDLLILAICTLAVVLVLSLFYRSSFIRKLFLSIIFTVSSVVAETFISFLITKFISTNVEFLTSNIFFYILDATASNILIFIILKVIQYYKRTNQDPISGAALISIILMPIMTIIILYIIVDYAYRLTTLTELSLVVSSIFFLLILNAFIIYIFEKQIKQDKERRDLLLVQQNLKMQAEYFREIAEKHKQSAKAVHDMKNSLYSIAAAIKNNKTEYAAEKINELCVNVFNTKGISNTGNDAIDALISSKYNRINKNDIKFITSIFMSPDNIIDDSDLCVVIGNALDNAIEACERIEKNDERLIRLNIRQIEDNLSIRIINSIDRNEDKDQTLQTRKKDKQLHGFGLKSIKEIVNKYDGNVDHSIINGTFNLEIYMQNEII